MERIARPLATPVIGAILGLLVSATAAFCSDIADFVGRYKGSAEVETIDGSTIPRDMSVEITQMPNGFELSWTSKSYRADGTSKEKSYSIDFEPSERGEVYSAVMKRNVFGHGVQLDPMAGEPYVWARLSGDTLSLYSLYVDEDGGYEIQQFDRTLAEGGLDLEYQSVRNGEIKRTVSTFLERK